MNKQSPKIQESEKLFTFSTSLADVSRRADRIIEVRFRLQEYEVDVAEILEIRDGIKKILENDPSPFPLLVVPGSYGTITKEAREMEMFDDDVLKHQLAMALVVPTLSQRIIGSLYIKLKKKKLLSPYKLFNSEKTALNWLRKQIKN
jgi:hypothetical protein